MSTAQNPLMSIVITSYTMERFKDICELLDSIGTQTLLTQTKSLLLTDPKMGKRELNVSKTSVCNLSPIEVIFIAERSGELYERVREYANKPGLQNTRVLFSEEKLGLGGARNLGTKEAKGEIVAFVDDDVVLFPEWAEEMLKTYEEDSAIGVSGAALPLWQDKRLDWLPKIFYWLISCTGWTGWNEVTEARSLWGMNMSLRREAFEKAGSFLFGLGYHQPMAEDLEFSLRVRTKTGKKLLFNPKAKVWHKVYAYRISPRFVASRAHHIGTSRRLLRTTHLREQATFHLEKGVLSGIAKGICLLPQDFCRNPSSAWKVFYTTIIIVTFAAIGFLFPGKALGAAKEIEYALKNQI